MNELFSVAGKVVVITGGTGVLGSCIGKYLATQGAKVVLLGRRKDEGDRIVDEIVADGGEAVFMVSDVMNPEILQA
ncbi:MAG: SDR family NAD(P)-dependent oxidoreductase, partial [Muribaculaceae bacterium]|nr:SDR family NAD(P)-dependent oxidoreductase [Muribaculaceae bacterium]